ncbi:hypothetical protein NC651_029476 [Populus alba x Populus x berolinensis]|nr:hypothetical protein NC651_029476 [Populus alba x Populus x berolinensis]
MAHTPTYCRHQTTQLEGELTNQAAETSTLALNIQDPIFTAHLQHDNVMHGFEMEDDNGQHH